MQLPYKTALITGATSGIGEAFAKKLPATTNLILTGRNGEKLRQLQEELQTEARTVTIVPADLAQSAGIEDLLSAIQSTPIDLFINNAGLGQYGNFADHTLQSEMHMIKVNVMAVTHLAHALCPTMAMQDTPTAMVVVSSVAGFIPLPGFATYAATKAFDLYLAEALAEEFKETNLHIMTLCPGATTTNFGLRSGMTGENPDPNAMTADAVAAEALEGLKHKKRIVVTGLTNKMMVQLPRFFPRRFTNWAAGTVIKNTRPAGE